MRYGTRMVLAGVVVLLSACTSANSENDAEGLNVQAVTLSDAQIVRVMQVLNDGEVVLGKMGEARAKATSARDFNAKMVTEHTEARQRLDALSKDQDIMPAESQLSVQLVAEVQGQMRVLSSLEGEAFDQALMDVQVLVHARAAMVMDALVVPQVKDDALAAEAVAERQTVQKHLEEALSIQKTLFEAPETPAPP
ncbi:DUF4142 domain-containing protein [Myxococcus stipitatus]|uniref:DUF4142 domain-containing protein n=1 Tax=Myxococcus stipitatus TaxID=83455 RepID=UPI001F3E137A|nr:DUF4142 domain-containing protein [Myxococcus stipitatus]MCE9673122.1 DUF4142 domain-containing protein [Myxococcus stipitatus]